MSEKYLDNRLKYHTASRVAAKETDPLLNSMNFDGHTVPFDDVWASSANNFPKNTNDNSSSEYYYVDGFDDDFNFKTTTDGLGATNNLVKVFTHNFNSENNSNISNISFKNGSIWTNTEYPAVKLFYQVEMSGVQYSNSDGEHYEAYEILGTTGTYGKDNVRFQDWVSPTAIFDTDLNRPIPGYTGIVEISNDDGSTWSVVQSAEPDYSLMLGNWEFMYPAGIITFARGLTPTDKGYSKIRWTGFLYTGIYLDKKIANTFAGVTINPVNLDTYKTVGIYRIDDDTSLNNPTLTGTTPPITNCTGFLQVMDINRDEDRTDNKDFVRVRQIIYPDNKYENSPYSRVGSVDDVNGNITWSEWTQMGGGSLRRIVVTGDRTIGNYSNAETDNEKIQNNVMYESFGSNTFILPSAANVPVGTKIGIEQHAEEAYVKLDGDSEVNQVIAPTRNTSRTIIEPTSYVFECILQQDNSTHEWVLDAEHNYGAVITDMNSRITDISEIVNAQNKNISEHIDKLSRINYARPMRYLYWSSASLTLEYNKPNEQIPTELTSLNIDTYVGRIYKMSSTSSGTFVETYITKEHVGNYIKPTNQFENSTVNEINTITNLYYNNVHIVCSPSVSTITFPANLPTENGSTFPTADGAIVMIEIPYGSTITIRTMSGSSVVNSEVITSDSNNGVTTNGQYLTLQFEYIQNNWMLLSLA